MQFNYIKLINIYSNFLIANKCTAALKIRNFTKQFKKALKVVYYN